MSVLLEWLIVPIEGVGRALAECSTTERQSGGSGGWLG